MLIMLTYLNIKYGFENDITNFLTDAIFSNSHRTYVCAHAVCLK